MTGFLNIAVDRSGRRQLLQRVMALAFALGATHCQEPPPATRGIGGAATSTSAASPAATTNVPAANAATSASTSASISASGTAQPAAKRPPPRRGSGMVDRWGYVEIPPRTTFDPHGAFDLLIHFHGGGLDSRAEKAALDAVLVSTTLGDGSGRYQELFSQGYTLSRALAGIERRVRKQSGVKNAYVRRLALSSFSAGYGAVAAILADPDNDDRIDALLMADGIHVDFEDIPSRTLAETAMQRYLRFGRAAARRDKLFLLSHSRIPTSEFASTSETAAFLVDRLAVPARNGCGRGKRLRLVSCHRRGQLIIAGYGGSSEDDHMAHAYAQHLMYRALRKRWNAPHR